MSVIQCQRCSAIVERRSSTQKYCPACSKEAKREHTKRWYKLHPDWNREKSRRWRKKHPERSRESAIRYALANLEKVLERNRRRRARRAGATGSHTRVEFLRLCEQLGWKCVYCGTHLTPRTATEDHVVPLSCGGSDDLSNIVPACRSCNVSKSTKIGGDFVRWLIRVTRERRAS